MPCGVIGGWHAGHLCTTPSISRKSPCQGPPHCVPWACALLALTGDMKRLHAGARSCVSWCVYNVVTIADLCRILYTSPTLHNFFAD